LAAALAAVDPDELGRRLDLGSLDEATIYPGAWGRNGLGVESVLATYRDMRALVLRLAERGLGLLLYIN
jgi:hypothetical protein